MNYTQVETKVMPTANNLFKFVALRPVQKVSKDNLERHFIKYTSRNNNQPQIYSRLMAQDSMSLRKQEAANFILSPNYVTGFDYEASWVGFLQEIFGTLTRRIRQRTGLQQVKTAVSSWVEQYVEQLAGVKNQLWSSLYAAIISPRTLPHDRSELINLIRILFFIEKHELFDGWEEIADLLVAKPLIPEELFIVQSAQRPPETPSDEPTWQQQTRELFEYFRDQIYALQSASLEIEQLEQRNLRRLGGRSESGVISNVVTNDDSQISVVSSSSNNTWRLSTDTIASLSSQAKEVVSDNKLSLEEDSTVDIINGLEAAQRQHFASIYKFGGLRAVKTVGLRELSRELSYEWLEEHLKPNTTPWLFPQDENRFDEPIEGSVGSVEPVGVGDLLVVRETIWKYEMGEVAHIENILQTESKERIHRRLDRTETVVFTETETTTQSERDLQTTERFELQTEIQKTLQQDSEMQAGLEVAGGYGPVKVTASAEFATSTSQSESTRAASNFAQEVTDRSVESLTERIKESLTTTVINEIEETNTHGFDNTNGTGHICGIYRWVDKYYLGQVYNYGKRLMFEFIVPQPAAFYLHAQTVGPEDPVTLAPPEPLAEDFSFTDIKPGNYETWVDKYQVTNVSPPPPKYKIIAKAISQSETEPKAKADSLSLPAGYIAKEGHVSWSYGYYVNPGSISVVFSVILGRQKFSLHSGEYFNPLDDEDSTVPIGIRISSNLVNYAITIEVKCKRSDETLDAWKLATYNAIVEAYNQQKAAYDAQVAAREISQGVVVSGNNPDKNRQIEQEELKRGCLTLFTNQHFASFSATLFNVAPHGYPEFDVGEAMDEGLYVQFFEQAFEWDKMSYLFYPYFWGRKEDWAINSQLSDTDPQFEGFLKAGGARVLVPVRRYYEASLLHYHRTGEIWNGGESPTINNNLYVSIVDEMIEAADADLANAAPQGDPWEIKLPTELVRLQEDSALPDWTDELFPE